jgi:hypothetical protein
MQKGLTCVLLVAVALLCSNSFGASAKKQNVARIVATVHLRNQTKLITNKIILTSKKDTTYRVSGYINAKGTNGGDWFMGVSWTDNYGNQTCGQDGGCGGTYSQFLSITVRDIAGAPLAFSTTGRGDGPYDVFLTVEELP